MFFRRKKEDKDTFYEAVRTKNWRKVVKIGQTELEKHGSKTPLDVIVTIASAYCLLKKKKEAVKFLLEAAKEKAGKGLIEDAEFLLQKAYELKRTPEVVEELINFYLTRDNKEKVVEILSNLLTEAEEKDDPKLLAIVEDNVYKINEGSLYAHLASIYEGKSPDKAYNYWLKTAEIYEQKGIDEYAFRALMRAKKVKNTKEINERIIDFIAVKSKKFPVSVLIQILQEVCDPNFWLWVFEEFRSKGNIEIFKSIIDNEKVDNLIKFFFTVLLLADIKGVFAEDILEEIEKRDNEIYLTLIDYLSKKYGTKLINAIFGEAKISIEEILAFEPDNKAKPVERKEATDAEGNVINFEEININFNELFK